MTPAELLELAKSHFVVLYHSDETKLGNLLKRALGKFSEKAGVTITAIVPFTAPGDSGSSPIDFVAPTPLYYAPLPDYFKDIAIAKDAKGLWHEVTIGVNPEDDPPVPSLVFSLVENVSVSPMTLEYFVELMDWDEDTDLPVGVASMVLDYLIALIDVPNTERERAVAQQAGQMAELPSKSELMDKVTEIEQSWEENAAFIGSTATW